MCIFYSDNVNFISTYRSDGKFYFMTSCKFLFYFFLIRCVFENHAFTRLRFFFFHFFCDSP